MDDWKGEIVKGWIIHQRIVELDRRGLWQKVPPEVAASEDELAATEAALGYPLDPKYRAFLGYGNGWRNFLQEIDLFGTRNLLGAPPMDAARAMLDTVDPGDFEGEVGMGIADVLPIGASEVQMDMFLLGQPWSSAPGTVIWFAGGLVDRYPDFDEFFLAMLDYNRYQVQKLEKEG